jgi:hypothetical protein
MAARFINDSRRGSSRYRNRHRRYVETGAFTRRGIYKEEAQSGSANCNTIGVGEDRMIRCSTTFLILWIINLSISHEETLPTNNLWILPSHKSDQTSIFTIAT